MESRQQGGPKPKKSLEGWQPQSSWYLDSGARVPRENKPPRPFPVRTLPFVRPTRRIRKETTPPRKRSRWQLGSCADAGAVGAARPAGCGSQGGRRRSPSLRCPRRCHDSGIAGGGGGGRLDCRLPDRLGVEGEGLGPKAQARGARAGAQGPRPFLFPCLVPPGLKAVRPEPTCGLPRGARSHGVNKARLAAGGVWRPAQLLQSHCGALQAPQPSGPAREAPVVGSGGPGPCQTPRHCTWKEIKYPPGKDTVCPHCL